MEAVGDEGGEDCRIKSPVEEAEASPALLHHAKGTRWDALGEALLMGGRHGRNVESLDKISIRNR